MAGAAPPSPQGALKRHRAHRGSRYDVIRESDNSTVPRLACLGTHCEVQLRAARPGQDELEGGEHVLEKECPVERRADVNLHERDASSRLRLRQMLEPRTKIIANAGPERGQGQGDAMSTRWPTHEWGA